MRMLQKIKRVLFGKAELRKARELPATERYLLWDEAANDYVNGRISAADYHRAQELYGLDYAAMARAIVWRRKNRVELPEDGEA